MGCDRAVAQDCNGTWFLSLAFAGLLPVRLDLVFSEWADCWSSGLFFLKGFYILTFPVAFRVLGSSIPELGNAINGDTALNPVCQCVDSPRFSGVTAGTS